MTAAADARGSGDEIFSSERTSGRAEAVLTLAGGYEDFIREHDDPLLTRYRGMGWREYAKDRTAPPFVQELLAQWRRLYDEPFTGVTTDGHPVAGLYPLDETAPNPAAREAAERLLALLDEAQREEVRYRLDAREWRGWSNPEFVVNEIGIRLEDASEEVVRAALRVMAVSLSPAGYARVRRLMDLNGFLGELNDLPSIMNPRSFWFAVYGTPSDDEPWGWQLFGHHVAVHYLSVGGRVVVAPVFLGAEPATSGDDDAGVFEELETAAAALGRSFTPSQRDEAVVYASVLDDGMPEGRLHPADERHVAGAFRDNRVVPPEGLAASRLDGTQRYLLRLLLAQLLILLPEDETQRMLNLIGDHLDETRIAWYGATDGSEPFYLRVHGPVVLAELDHHGGVWLTNQQPAKFHVHTLVRLPNGGDYGRALIDQWRARRHLDTDPTWRSAR